MILILGEHGQLGFEFQRLLGNNAYYLNRSHCDLSKKEEIVKLFKDYQFSTLINAAAYTFVDKAEDDRDSAFKINAIAPGLLAELCAEHSIRFVHFSTDYVFDGGSESPYREDHPLSPINYYGYTKAEGEQTALNANSEALIIRTSWVYSSHGNNFLKTMIKLGNSKDELNVVNDQIGSPTWAKELAKVALLAVDKNLKGIYHYSQGGSCSWYDFASEIKRLTGFRAKINPIPSRDYPTKANRPKFSLLSKDKIKNDLNLEIPHWKDSLREMIKEVI